MPRGGARPNSGPEKGTKYKPRAKKEKKKPSISKKEINDQEMMPKDYFLKIMRDPSETDERRDKAAYYLLQYCHQKASEPKGKRQEREDKAYKAGTGKFQAGPAPLRMVK